LEEVGAVRLPCFELENIEVAIFVHGHQVWFFLPRARLHHQDKFVVWKEPVERLEKDVL
jgi:hypothetical protein